MSCAVVVMPLVLGHQYTAHKTLEPPGWSTFKEKTMKKLFVLLFLLLASPVAYAADVTLTWSWPDTYCADANGVEEPLPLSDITAAEVYIALATIPRVPGTCGTQTDTPPSGAIIQQITTPDTSVSITLPCGNTYFFVMRVQDVNGLWSNFSTEATRILECGRPGVPIIISLS